MIYTSYWGRVKALEKFGIEPVAISRGRPKGWFGRSIESLCPSWQMLRLPVDEFYRRYDEQLARTDPAEVVRELGDEDVALLCWEKEIGECHRHRVVDWLRAAGYVVEEFNPAKVKEERDNGGTMPLF
ncbi:MAG: DUF488 family protein [Eggerthellaceae bacterium]|nr:DUF488 family protein [Eggerthellaceae bacterium]